MHFEVISDKEKNHLKPNPTFFYTNDVGFFSHGWSTESERDHLKSIKKKIIFKTPFAQRPKEVKFYDVNLKNCSNLRVLKITKKYFIVSFQGIMALENSIDFNWQTL